MFEYSVPVKEDLITVHVGKLRSGLCDIRGTMIHPRSQVNIMQGPFTTGYAQWS